jgi:ankyrin repeat protein
MGVRRLHFKYILSAVSLRLRYIDENGLVGYTTNILVVMVSSMFNQFQDNKNAGSLFNSIENGDINLCREALKDSSITNAIWSGRKPLHKAAIYDRTEICAALLDAGSDIEAVDSSGKSPLCLAVSFGNKSTFEKLLYRGANVNSGLDFYQQPLFNAVYHGYIEICLQLLYRGAHIQDGIFEELDISDSSFGDNYQKCVYALIAYGAKPLDRFPYNKTPLEAAALLGDGALLNNVLSFDADKLSLPIRASEALQIAKDGGVDSSISILRSWISRQAANDVLAEIEKDNKLKEEKIDEFISAIKTGDIAEVKKLISEGVDINSMSSDYREEKPLLCFAACQDNNRVLLELIRLGANIEAKSASGRTALFSACSRMNGLHNLSALLEHGANIDAVDNYGNTPLIQASSVSLKDECLLLIERGANLDIKNNEGKSALSCALSRFGTTGIKEIDDCSTDICLALIANGASTTESLIAVRYNGDNQKTIHTLLECAAFRKHGVLLTKLLEVDPDPKTLPIRAAQALKISIEGNKHESVAILNSWISRQAAMAAIAEFAEPAIEPTSPQEHAARSTEISMAKVISDCRTDSQDAAEVQVNDKLRKAGRKMD